MTGKEILIILGMSVAGFLLLGLVFGFLPALKIIGMIGGGMLLFVAINIVIDKISMEANESLAEAQAKRQGKMYVNTAFAARDHKEYLENESKFDHISYGKKYGY